MNERVSRSVVTFAQPFRVEGEAREQPAGTYEVETVEEQLEGISFLAFRIRSTSILLPVPGRGPSAWQRVPIDAAVVRAAALATETAERSEQTGEA